MEDFERLTPKRIDADTYSFMDKRDKRLYQYENTGLNPAEILALKKKVKMQEDKIHNLECINTQYVQTMQTDLDLINKTRSVSSDIGGKNV